MNEGRFPAGGRFHFLLFSETLPSHAGGGGEQPFGHTKSKASEYEQ